MDVLKELLDNARKLLGQMSSTQRASIVAMVATVAALLVMVVWLGSISEKKTRVPLEITIPMKDAEAIIDYIEQCRDNAGLSDELFTELVASFIAKHELSTEFIHHIEDNIS